MKVRQNRTKHPLYFCIAMILLVSLSCDQPRIPVSTNGDEDQIVLVSKGINDNNGRIGTLKGWNQQSPPLDSVLLITYQRDDSSTDEIIETFEISLQHKLSADSFLNYGTVTIGGVQVQEKSAVALNVPVTTYDYYATRLNGASTTYSSWSDAFNLEQGLVFTASNSPVIKDFTQEIPVRAPNWITYPSAGQTVSVSNDLQISFHREIAESTVVTLGSHAVDSCYHFTLLWPSTRLTIPSIYLQTLMGTSTSLTCQVSFEEQLSLGSLTSENKITHQLYGLPICEMSGENITLELVK